MENYIFDFVDYKIVNINFSLTGKSPAKIEISPKIEIRHEKDGNHLKIFLGVVFENPKAPFVFTVRLAGLFTFKQDITNDDLGSIANVNCAAILYPFVRETVADLTRRSGFPALLLPPLNFVRLYEENIKAEKFEKPS
jgi:preprotein translocase subunit SecB